MARPMRRDADYFPFICKEGKTFSILRNRFPLEGIGFFTELCIILTTTPDHHIQLKTDLDFEYLCSKMKCEKSKATDIIDTLVMTGKIHKELWESANVIVIPDLLESLKDAYLKRETDIITINQIVSSYINSVFDTGNPCLSSNQSLKDSKGNKSKPDNNRFIIPTVEQIKEYCTERNNKIDAEYFFNYYQSKGWMIGKNKMKDWQSAVITWEKREKEFTKDTPKHDRHVNPGEDDLMERLMKGGK